MANSNGYQYNSCVSRGICSIDPRTSALQEILLMYLKISAYYVQLLKKAEFKILILDGIRELVLDTISAMVSNQEFSVADFEIISERYNEILPNLIEEYEQYCRLNNLEPKFYRTKLKFKKSTDLSKYIRMGEKEFLRKIQNSEKNVVDLYRILFVVLKSICINILDLKAYDKNADDGYLSILKVLNFINNDETNIEKIKGLLEEIVQIDVSLLKSLRNEQERLYGKQTLADVSYSTTPSHAILAVGSSLNELEHLLEASKNKDIHIYTHDKMLIAHTFPKFREYKNLKGHYGKSSETCLLDFATFPGPIVLTKHSLFNVENFYRGRLYTTDLNYSKGIIKIENGDFSDVIEMALNEKGFKSGRTYESKIAGFDFDKTADSIKEKLDSFNYKKLIIIASSCNTKDWKNYFEDIFSKANSDTLIINISSYKERDNIINLNSEFDEFSIIKILENIKGFDKLKTAVFFPECDLHTISSIIYLQKKFGFDVFVGKCSPIIINPVLFETLFELFDSIKSITTHKNDLDKIL